MAIIPQIHFFDFMKCEDLGDLEKLKLILESLPDEELVRTLEKERKKGRDDYPVRAMWNSIIAGVIYRHESTEKLIEELSRNGQLRFICGFRKYEAIRNEQGVEIGSKAKIPRAYNYSRFVKNLLKHQSLINKMFDDILLEIKKLLPDFGETLAIDGKAINSYATKVNKKIKKDGRRDLDANVGIKKYTGENDDGTSWEKIKSWFGYKLHLIVDTKYELPIAFSVTKASAPEIPEGKKLIENIEKKHPDLLKRCEYYLGDRGYDDTKTIKLLWDKYEIKPVIDIRNLWGIKDEIRMFENRHNIIGYDNFGCIYCYDPLKGDRHLMGFKGFEENRETLKYMCPVNSNGVRCKGCNECPYYNKSIRIKLEEDRRRFTPLARSTYKWDRIYKSRTAVERVNSRIDNVYGFERHFIRGIQKMNLRCSLSLIVMLAMAVGRIKQNKPHLMRSLKAG